MATQKITLNELRSVIRQIIKEESEGSNKIKEMKTSLVSTLKKRYQSGSDIYNAYVKDESMGQKAIEGRIKQMDVYFNDNRNLSLDAIANGSREPNTEVSSPYYTGGILTYLDNLVSQSGFYSAMNKKPLDFNKFYNENKIDVILDKVIEVIYQEGIDIKKLMKI